MGHGVAAAPDSTPRANAVLAAGCDVCSGWGSVITPRGLHELCPDCQPHSDQSHSGSGIASREV
ncbi:hypothetical protein STSP_36980 [Streptomyces jeddahensis]|uniref:Uncharacterized protein n=1 Tax=Streptomyces jeddahensis TaxID=1716141 RepID=A0A177HPX9_9ACTN|nr:hypothetical protein STSP_36980 [Streptomyces jeddahensis]